MSHLRLYIAARRQTPGSIKRSKWYLGFRLALAITFLAYSIPALANDWKTINFSSRPLYAYPLSRGHDDVVGSLTTYRIQPGDTLLDVGRWFGLSAREVSEANNHLDWWSPPAGKEILLPTEHILPAAPHRGIILNIPEMRLYYFYPVQPIAGHHKGRTVRSSQLSTSAQVVYTFPVGLGRFDWKTPVGEWRIVSKTKNPTWVVPKTIYEEHLERDGEAVHRIEGGDPDNPLGLYRLSLSLPEYGLHGTDVPWGVGMNVSHGCIRLYPEDIERLFSKVKVGTPGLFVYQPIKFGWRGDSLYVEVHEDLYARYPGPWNHAVQEMNRLGLQNDVDLQKLEKAVVARSGVATYVMVGPEPGVGPEVERARADMPSVSESPPAFAANPGGTIAASATRGAASEPAFGTAVPATHGDWDRIVPGNARSALPIE